MNGVTVYINGIGYWFEDSDWLIELLDFNCNDVYQSEIYDKCAVEYDE